MSSPTNGELNIMFSNLEEKFSEKHEDVMKVLTRIETQTTKTNGRVNSLEKSRIKVWTSIVMLTFLGGAIITLSVMAIDTKIEKGIVKALAENVEKITPAE